MGSKPTKTPKRAKPALTLTVSADGVPVVRMAMRNTDAQSVAVVFGAGLGALALAERHAARVFDRRHRGLGRVVRRTSRATAKVMSKDTHYISAYARAR